MMYTTIGFIGSGTMASAIAGCIAKEYPRIPMIFSNRTPLKAENLAKTLPCAKAATNPGVASEAHLLFLGVKPQFMKDALDSVSGTLKERAEKGERFVLVTMAAGLTTETIQTMAGGRYPVIRIMPNTPAAIGCGVTQYCGKDVTEEEMNSFAEVMKGSGLVDPLPENLMDAAACVSGCGPAFVYMFIEALSDGGVACGLPRAKAMAYAAQMVEGAAKMVLESKDHPGKLKDAVTSPGGTTIQGVRALENHGFRAAATEAVIAAYEKTMLLKGGKIG